MTINVNLSRISATLERLADAADRAFPPIDVERLASRRPHGPDAIIRYGEDEKLWQRETFKGLIHEAGLSPSQETEVLEEILRQATEDDLSSL